MNVDIQARWLIHPMLSSHAAASVVLNLPTGTFYFSSFLELSLGNFNFRLVPDTST